MEVFVFQTHFLTQFIMDLEIEKNKNFDDADISAAAMKAHVDVSRAQSRLHTARTILGIVVPHNVETYALKEHAEHVEEVFAIKVGPYRIGICLQSHSTLSTRKKRVANQATALTNNKVAYLLQSDWETLPDRIDSVNDKIQDLIKRLFITCAETSQYEIEFDAKYWNWLYVDPRNNTSLEITIER